MAILRQDRAPEPTLFQSDTAIWTSAESTGLTGRDLRPLTGRDLRPLDRTGRKSRARSAMPSVAAADVVILVVGYVDGRPVLMGSLILGYQPAWPGVRAVIEEEPVHVLIPRILVPGDVLRLSSSMSRAVSGSSSASNWSRDSPDPCSSVVEPNQCAAADAGQPQPSRAMPSACRPPISEPAHAF
jgi:hypothetical protein